MARQKRRRARSSLVTKILVLALLGGIGWQLHALQGQVESAQAKKDALAAQVQTHELGLVYPNERVFSDISN